MAAACERQVLIGTHACFDQSIVMVSNAKHPNHSQMCPPDLVHPVLLLRIYLIVSFSRIF